MKDILKTWAHTSRFIIVITSSCFMIFVFTFYVYTLLFRNKNFHMDFRNDKTLVTVLNSHDEISANSILPSCDCWIYTGIEIKPNEEYEIKVSGKIHATIDKLIRYAEKDTIPKYPWSGPLGVSYVFRGEEFKEQDSCRRQLLLYPEMNVGQVLLYFKKTSNDIEPNCSAGIVPETKDIQPYNSNGINGENTSKEIWNVYATVNDFLIRDFNTPCALQSLKKQGDSYHKTFESLRINGYRTIYFDDNIGNFIISAHIKKNDSFFFGFD